jgi:hypothetical protein
MLQSTYTLHSQQSNATRPQEVWHIYYPGEINYREFVPLLITYAALFFYVYFSLRKMEFVKSKVISKPNKKDAILLRVIPCDSLTLIYMEK